MATASADPDKLDKAAAAVPAEVKSALNRAAGHGGLSSRFAQFAQMHQHPWRLVLSADGLVGAVLTAIRTGDELDARLAQIATEFRRAGGDGSRMPWGWQGPPAPGSPAAEGGDPSGTRYMDNAALQAAVDQWRLGQGPEVRQRADGKVEMLGPNGEWYVVVGSPPPGARPLGTSEGTVDFTNQLAGTIMSAAAIHGLMGGSTDPVRFAPREAYDYLQFDPNGVPIVGPGAGGYSKPLPKPYQPLPGPGDANQGFPQPPGEQDRNPPWRTPENRTPPWRPPEDRTPPGHKPQGWKPLPQPRKPLETGAGRVAGAAAFTNAAAELVKHATYGNANTFRTRTSYYIDPRTQQRVAVVDVASITYEKQDHDRDPATDARDTVVVRWGRVATDDQGRPTFVARPGDFSRSGEQIFPVPTPKEAGG